MVFELFTTSICPKCPQVKQVLDSKNFKYTERVVDCEPEALARVRDLNIYEAPSLVKYEDDGTVSETFIGYTAVMKYINREVLTNDVDKSVVVKDPWDTILEQSKGMTE